MRKCRDVLIGGISMNAPRTAPLAHRTALSVCIAALLAVPAPAAFADPTVWDVTNCSDSGPPITTLRQAIAAASSGDIIELGTAPCSVIGFPTSSSQMLFARDGATLAITSSAAAVK